MKLKNVSWFFALFALVACGSGAQEENPPPGPEFSFIKIVEDPVYNCVEDADCDLAAVDEDGCANYTLFGEHCSESKIYVVNQEERERRENLEVPIECEILINTARYDPDKLPDCEWPEGEAGCVQNKCVFKYVVKFYGF